jgi:hypothetical protein
VELLKEKNLAAFQSYNRVLQASFFSNLECRRNDNLLPFCLIANLGAQKVCACAITAQIYLGLEIALYTFAHFLVLQDSQFAVKCAINTASFLIAFSKISKAPFTTCGVSWHKNKHEGV